MKVEIESWQNNKWVPNSKIGTSLWSAHFFFGYAVFDAFRTYNHSLHMLNCHIDRLYRSAKSAFIDIPISKGKMILLIQDVMEHNKQFFPKDEEYRFMIFISPGVFKVFEDMGDAKPIVTINLTTTSRYAKYIAPYLEKGYTSLITHQLQIPSRFLDPKIKSCSRLHYGLAGAEAAQLGDGVMPILLDEHGYIAESHGSNVGFVKDDCLCLPKTRDMLDGCTMQFIKILAKNRCIDIIYDNWEPYDIINSDGIIFTSTFSGLMPSWKIIHKGQTHELNKDNDDIIDVLINEFSTQVRLDVKEQWRNWYDKNNP